MRKTMMTMMGTTAPGQRRFRRQRFGGGGARLHPTAVANQGALSLSSISATRATSGSSTRSLDNVRAALPTSLANAASAIGTNTRGGITAATSVSSRAVTQIATSSGPREVS